MNRQDWKNPVIWAVGVPALLALWVIVTGMDVLDQSKRTRVQRTTAAEVKEQALEIRAQRRLAGNAENADSVQWFEGESSARQCAKASFIAQNRLQRGESLTKKMADGGIQFTETYKLNAVRLIQAAQFIDCAERNYSSVNCIHINLTPFGGTSKDSWDATIRLQYTGR
ncbi:MAG: hypothetical protein JW810_04245 [Sedimentisphaerales bacterium]|nr:hypothetical protein [Sedimentisphaerales bacterium]